MLPNQLKCKGVCSKEMAALLPLLRLGDRLNPELEEEFFANHADKDVLGTHFPTPAAGHIINDREGWRFVAAADGKQRKRRD